MLGLDTQSNPIGPLRTGFDKDDEIIFGPGLQASATEGLLATTSIDWSVRGKSNCLPVKAQMACGACWAFAALGVLECMISSTKTGTGPLVPPVALSVQQIVDCTTNSDENLAKWGKNYGNSGCNGGWMSNAWNFIRDQGVMLQSDYPYTAKDGITCNHDPKKIVAKASAKVSLSSYTALTALAKGPIAIAISAGNNLVRYYSEGILTAANNCPTMVDHAVIIVGYDTQTVSKTVAGTPKTTCVLATATEIKNKTCLITGKIFKAATTKTKAQCCLTTTPPPTTSNVVTPYWII